MGPIQINYGVNYYPNTGSWLSVYGWSINPLVEFYIVENSDLKYITKLKPKGTAVIDGCAYNFYDELRVEKPSISGVKTFRQYWSVRTSKRAKGIVSITEHFNAWEKLGMNLGSIIEISFAVEGIQSSGAAEVYRNVLTVGDNVTGISA